MERTKTSTETTPPSSDDRMAWWREARFGMFIHWGVYAVPGGVYHGQEIAGASEWLMHHAKVPVAEYKHFAESFNLVAYDPEAWVRAAVEAGMGYIVITAKHHDGFALFPSEASAWNVAEATPHGRDLLGPLVAACRQAGLQIGFYYSQALDWVNGGATFSEIHLGNQRLPFAGAGTGSWREFRRVTAGIVALEPASELAVRVVPICIPVGAVMNLRAVYLTPC